MMRTNARFPGASNTHYEDVLLLSGIGLATSVAHVFPLAVYWV
jgi:hypothetical protein